MKWVMTDHVHYDRVAACWMIQRFIDPEAEFSFAPRTTPLDQLPNDAIPLAFPGAKLGPHDADGPLFMKVLKEYRLQDPALELMGEVIAKGVAYVLDDYRPATNDRYGQMGVGLASFADGMIILEPSDQKRLDDSYVVWEALYALFTANKQRWVDASPGTAAAVPHESRPH